jgi:hypothetical protein
MNKVLQFKIPNIETITNENIGEILLNINARTSADALASIKDLNTVDISIYLKRQNVRNETKVYDGQLGDLLEHQYANTTMLEVVKTGFDNSGYNFLLNFTNFPFILEGKDELIVKVKCTPSEAFNSATIADSTITMFTNPSPTPNAQGLIPIYTNHQVGFGNVSFDEDLGNNVARIVLVTDLSATYDASTKPQVKTARMYASGNYDEDLTDVELLAKNQVSLAVNPDSSIRNLVHYNSFKTLNNVKYKAEYSSAVDNVAKVLTTKLEIH